MFSPVCWGEPAIALVSPHVVVGVYKIMTLPMPLRLTKSPVAICRLKRVAADLKDSVKERLPEIPSEKNGRKLALIGAGPASLTVARDLMPLGYEITLFDDQKKGGGMMRSQILSFRLPDEVLDEEVGYILDMGVETRFGQRVESLKSVIDEGFDAVFIGTGAPKGRDLNLPGREQGGANIHGCRVVSQCRVWSYNGYR